MPRRTTNATMLGASMADPTFQGLQSGTRLVYLSLLAITRRPYVDNVPYLLAAIGRLSGLPAVHVPEALQALEDVRWFIPSRYQAFSEAYYLPEALQHDRSFHVENGMHRRSTQSRLRQLETIAPDLVELFSSDHPEWLSAADSADENARRMRRKFKK